LISKSSPFVIANSEAGLKANLMSSSLNRRVIYNAIEVNKEKISLINENRDYYLNKISNGKYKFGFNGVVFLSVANLLLIKDYPTVIEALSRIKYNFIYFIAGEGPERGRIESLIVQKGLCNKVILLGRRTDISKILFCCDIFINSSKGEGCSNSILEAIAHRKYVVASNVGGTPEILPKELGVLFPFQNVDSLVVSLHRAIANYKYVDFQQYEMHLEAFNVKIIADSFEQTFLNWNK
jgi:glycosyltransferase involved in cell wall biosynthesis